MSAETLFVLIFLSQVTLISILLPAKLIRLLGPKQTSGKYARSDKRSFLAYRLANGVAVLAGIGLLTAIVHFRIIGQITVTLALIGLSFLCQLLPLILLRTKLLSEEPTTHDSLPEESIASQYRSLRLFQATSPTAVGTAVLILFAFIAFQFTDLNGSSDVHYEKIVVVIVTNLFFVGAIIFNFSSLRKADNAHLKTQYRAVLVGINLMVFGSIMISIYWFSKEALSIFDLHQFRPAMMSAFLHIPALLLFKALFFSRETHAE